MENNHNASEEMLDTGKTLCLIIGAAVSGRKITVPDSFDVQKAIMTARDHNIVPIAYHALKKAGLSGKQMEQAERLSDNMVYRQIRQNRMEERISAAFSEKGIPHYILKGTQIQKHFPQELIRISTDSDFFVDRQHLENVTRIMRQLGFETTGCPPESRTCSFRRQPCYHVEVHFRLEDTKNPDEEDFLRTLLQDSVPEQGSRFAFSDENLYLHTFFHLYKHFVFTGAGIRMFLDIYLLSRNLQPDMSSINSRLATVRLDRFHQTVLRECGILFEGVPSDEKTDVITRRIILGGAFGNIGQMLYRNQITEERDSGAAKRNIAASIFGTNKNNLYRKYPFLRQSPWLLPFCQIHRAVTGVIKKPRVALLCFRSLRSVSEKKIRADKELLKNAGLYVDDESDV